MYLSKIEITADPMPVTGPVGVPDPDPDPEINYFLYNLSS